MKVTLALATLASYGIASVAAWGREGHEIIGSIASDLIKPSTLKVVNRLLGSDTMEKESTWADEVKKATGTGNWHFIDINTGANPANDPNNSKGTCTPVMERDCAGQDKDACIVSVISKQGEILKGACSSGNPTTQQIEALKYLIHFFGDIAQPLHACGFHRGGNDDLVAQFDTQVKSPYGSLQLHWIWDSSILVKTMGGTTSESSQKVSQAQVDAYAAKTLKRVQTGDYASSVQSWATCANPDAGTQHRCPLEWAADSSGLDCSRVYKGYSATADLGAEYYDKYKTTVDEQIAKGAVRLAAYLDEVLSCNTTPPPPKPTTTTRGPRPTTAAPAPTSTQAPRPTTTAGPAPKPVCKDADFPNFLWIRTENMCCEDPTVVGSKYKYNCCAESDTGVYDDCGRFGNGYKRTSKDGPFPKGKRNHQ
ncbi:S1/P1 nuclease-domain-containing protein [Fimicolochytrium jonesii]|uniref:S1/P1 nuclease-domain-containing protein n=1 Tax=Fimicolochytrium jonesii TaxID=1396493 RepID=UPI0022FF23EA|nr:S1/P1 nuclease-domain-containing protein [Fimicolochytrium jonesii]KAI8826937.1 S1/P1 nuclease-domain-containing protein [Fimicolochytrium jonesii]